MCRQYLDFCLCTPQALLSGKVCQQNPIFGVVSRYADKPPIFGIVSHKMQSWVYCQGKPTKPNIWCSVKVCKQNPPFGVLLRYADKTHSWIGMQDCQLIKVDVWLQCWGRRGQRPPFQDLPLHNKAIIQWKNTQKNNIYIYYIQIRKTFVSFLLVAFLFFFFPKWIPHAVTLELSFTLKLTANQEWE